MAPHSSKNNLISKPEVQFWLPIITLVLTVASSFYYFGIRLSLLEQQVTQTNLLITEYQKESKTIVNQVQDINSRVVVLETMEGIRKRNSD